MWRLRESAPKVSLEQTVYRIRQGRIQRLQKESRYLEVCEIWRARLTACERLYRYTLKIRNSGVVTASDLVSDAIQARSYTGHIFALPLHVKKVGFDW